VLNKYNPFTTKTNEISKVSLKEMGQNTKKVMIFENPPKNIMVLLSPRNSI
jgi:hypothetical protein